MMVTAEMREIQELRRSMGLRLLDPGPAYCWRCGKAFESQDRRTDRFCNWCRQYAETVHEPAGHTLGPKQ